MNKPCSMRPGHAGAIASAVAALFAASYTPVSLANPTGGQVVAGTVTIASPAAGQMNITQQSPKGIVNWNTFSIGSSEAVNIVQPSSSAALLNRVMGNDPSVIAGRLQANGKVFLVNPAGVVFVPGSSVNVGSMVASTLNISNDDFLAGNYHFIGASAAAVTNAGTLTAGPGGTIALLGGSVSNSGTVSARLGTVAMGAGNDITLDFAGDGLTTLKINQGAANALIGNTGTLAADGGMVVMSAQTADALAGTVINQQGIVRARSIAERNGHILLDGGTSGVTMAGGTLDATGGAGLTGGRIDVTGYNVALLAGANIDASGAAGGGVVYFGGGSAGQDPTIRNANAVWMSPTAEIHADALASGNGGNVVAFSETASRIYGTLTAKGGPQGGDGGLIETSGHYLDASLATIDASSPTGKGGTWRIDPTDLQIVTCGLDCGNYLMGQTNGSPPTITFTASGNPSLLDPSAIQNPLLSGTSVEVTTVGSPDSGQPGNISIAVPINASTPMNPANPKNIPTLTFDAAGSITDNGFNITSSGGVLNVVFNAAGSITIGHSATITSTAGPLNLVFDANVGSTTPNNAVTLTNVTIDTNGGSFTVGSNGRSPVWLSNSIVKTETGAISINGTAAVNDGVLLTSSLLDTTTGDVGLAGTTASSGNGVELNQSAVQTANGKISIEGTGQSTKVNREGIYIWGGEYRQINQDGSVTLVPNLQATGTGGMSLSGTVVGDAGVGTDLENAVVKTGSRSVGITGTAVVNGLGDGVQLIGTQFESQGGSLSLAGTLVGNTGVGTALANAVVTMGSGALDITGTAVVTAEGNGVHLIGTQIGSQGGNLSLAGTLVGGTGVGTDLENTTMTSVSGAVGITGTAVVNTVGDGVYLTGTQIESQAGSMSLDGTLVGDRGVGSAFQNALLKTASGAVDITGTATLGTSGDGVYLTGTQIESQGGNLSINGSTPVTGQGSSPSGVWMENSLLATAGKGNVTVKGAANGAVNTGVDLGYGVSLVNSSIEVADGTASVTGNANAPASISAYGVWISGGYTVYVNDSATLLPAFSISGTGSVAINGTATALQAFGVSMNSALIDGTTGAIGLTGTATATSTLAAATSTFGTGVTLDNSDITSTEGTVTLIGTVHGPGSTVGNTGMGVYLVDSSVGTVDGNISVQGTTVGADNNSSFGQHAKGVIGSDGYLASAGAAPAGIFTTTGTGSIGVTGYARGISGTGISLSDTTASATGKGTILLNGTIDTTNDGFGVLLRDMSISTTSGDLSVTGVVRGPAGPESYAEGVELTQGYTGPNTTTPLPAIKTDGGKILISGSAPATQLGTTVLAINNAPIASTSGSITLTGTTTGTPAPGTYSSGVVLESETESSVKAPTTVDTGNGTLEIHGSGSGANSQGVLVTDGTQIRSNNGGAIDIRGVVTSPTTTSAGGNTQYDYGTLILNGSVTSTMSGSLISIAGSTNTSDAGLAFGAVPLPANGRSASQDGFTPPYTVGAVTIAGAPTGFVVLRAANDNTTQSLLSRNATLSGGGGTLSLLPAAVNPSTFDFVSQDSTPITLFGFSGGMSIDSATFASFVNFQALTLGSDTQTGLITINGVCASGGSSCVLSKPNLDMNLTLSSPGAGSHGIQMPLGLSVGSNHTLTLISSGAVTDPGGIQAASLLLSGPGTFTLDDPQNSVGVLAMVNAGNVNFRNSGDVVIGPVMIQSYDPSTNKMQKLDGTNSTLTGSLIAQSATGNLTLNSSLSAGGTADLVAENGVFTAAPSSTLTAGSGGWRIWTNTWVRETRNNVQPGNVQPNFYGCTFGSGCSWGGTVPLTGNHFVYVQRPTLTITADGKTRLTGAPNPTTFTYGYSGLVNGDSAADAFNGTVTSSATTNSPAGMYAINPNFASNVGYIVNEVPATLDVISLPSPIAQSGLQTFFTSQEQTFVYENNLQGTNICVGVNQPLFTETPPGDNQDLLAVEWKRVRSQPNLNSCMTMNSQHGCSDF